MASLPIGGARQAALERLRYVLREQLASELTAAITAHNPALVATLAQPAPTDAAIYITRTIDPAEVVRNHGVAVTMAPASARRIVETYSCGPTEQRVNTTQEVDVALVFEAEVQDALEVGGVEIEQDELMHLRAELYAAALINCLHKYACDNGTIHNVELLDDYPPEVFDDKRGVWAAAMITLRITQIVTIPQRRALP